MQGGGGSAAPSAPPLTAAALTPAQAAAAAALQRIRGAGGASGSLDGRGVADSSSDGAARGGDAGEAAGEHQSCSICLDDFEEGSQVRLPSQAPGQPVNPLLLLCCVMHSVGPYLRHARLCPCSLRPVFHHVRRLFAYLTVLSVSETLHGLAETRAALCRNIMGCSAVHDVCRSWRCPASISSTPNAWSPGSSRTARHPRARCARAPFSLVIEAAEGVQADGSASLRDSSI